MDHHAAILDAVRRQNEAGAVAAMRRHMEVNVQHLAGERAPTPEAPPEEDQR
jgi:DNA-binding GntR family transcriptional regulator